MVYVYTECFDKLTSDVAGFVECLITRPTMNFLMPTGEKYT